MTVSSKIQSDTTEGDTSTVYTGTSSNDLSTLTAALLLTADCMGTGILALPADIQTLGRGVGLAFLILNLPINLYAGTILGWTASFVEDKVLQRRFSNHFESELELANEEGTNQKRDGYCSVQHHENDQNIVSALASTEACILKHTINDEDPPCNHEWYEDESISTEQQDRNHTDTATFDFVGMTSILFDEPIIQPINKSCNRSEEPKQRKSQYRSVTYNHPFTKLVLFLFYTNLFLVLGMLQNLNHFMKILTKRHTLLYVLGNYILVMSHAVSAMAGEENLCIPTAGIIASTLMFGLSQLRTMANLGRSVSFISLLALFIVVLQCLYALRLEENKESIHMTAKAVPSTTDTTLSKMSSIAAIGFAVGSQKLLLNIRHEMIDRTKAAPNSLSIALTLYGFAYIIVCLLAGPTPPSFLFDSIPIGSNRRLAGLLLWVHVAVSYAINSQALCSSLDRILVHSYTNRIGLLERRHRLRWLILTASVSTASYFVANAVPFFKVSAIDIRVT